MTSGWSIVDTACVIVAGSAASFLSVELLAWPQSGWAIMLAWIMATISCSDARRYIVPDILSLPAIPAGLLASGYLGQANSATLASPQHLVAMVAGAVGFVAIRIAYRQLREREGLGLGDVKLAAAGGAWTGPDGLLMVILYAATTALVFVAAVLVYHKFTGYRGRGMSMQTAVPFGTFLATATWFVYVAQCLRA